jgi:hypothetical protein
LTYPGRDVGPNSVRILRQAVLSLTIYCWTDDEFTLRG